MWTYVAILIVTLFFLLHKYCSRKFDYWKNKNVHFIKPSPFFGNVLNILTRDPPGQNFVKVWNSTGNKDFFGLYVFDRPTLVVTSPKLVKAILQKDSSVFIDRTVAHTSRHPIMSNALFSQRNPEWKEARTKLSPIFTSGKLKLMFSLMLKESKEMTDYIGTIANVPDIETKEICAKFSTNVIARCAFAVEANCFKNKDAVFRNVGRQMFDFRVSTALRQIGSFLLPNLYETLNIPFIDPKIIDSLQGIFTDVLRSRKASPNRKGNDFVDILLDAHGTSGENSFSEEAMLGHAIQMFGAGFETVSASLSFTLYELSINSNIQEKLRQEIKDHIAKNNGVTYEMLPEMKYLDMCISETLRKYPVAPILDRMCNSDYKFEDIDLTIEKGIGVYIPVYALNYSPKYFPDPEKYDPDRFSDKFSINQDGLWFVPFGEGPRICIGQRFALMEVKIALIAILSNYRLEKTSKTPIPIKYKITSLVLQSTVGIPLKFVPI